MRRVSNRGLPVRLFLCYFKLTMIWWGPYSRCLTHIVTVVFSKFFLGSRYLDLSPDKITLEHQWWQIYLAFPSSIGLLCIQLCFDGLPIASLSCVMIQEFFDLHWVILSTTKVHCKMVMTAFTFFKIAPLLLSSLSPLVLAASRYLSKNT